MTTNLLKKNITNLKAIIKKTYSYQTNRQISQPTTISKHFQKYKIRIKNILIKHEIQMILYKIKQIKHKDEKTHQI